MPSSPGALPLDSCLMALIASSTVGSLSSSFITRLCGSSEVASSDIVDWRLSSWLKCYAHLSVMRVGSLITVCPSRSKSGLVPLDDGPWSCGLVPLDDGLEFTEELLSILCIRSCLEFSCPITPPLLFHLSELGLSLLFHLVVTIFLCLRVFVVYILNV